MASSVLSVFSLYKIITRNPDQIFNKGLHFLPFTASFMPMVERFAISNFLNPNLLVDRIKM